jgi:hypothetical protein
LLLNPFISEARARKARRRAILVGAIFAGTVGLCLAWSEVGATVVSWAITLGVLGLLSTPVVLVNGLAKRRLPARRGVLTGATVGLLIVPFSVWLYAQFFVDPIRALLFGFPGLFSLMLHAGFVGGAEDAETVFVVNAGSGLLSLVWNLYLRTVWVWVPAYAAIGALYDRFLGPLQPWRPAPKPRM